MSRDERLPKSVRNAAKKNIEPVGLKQVEAEVADSDWEALFFIARDRRLPESVRKAARKNIEPAALKWVEDCARDFEELSGFWTILVIATKNTKNNRLPEKARKAALEALKLKAVELVPDKEMLTKHREFSRGAQGGAGQKQAPTRAKAGR